MRRPLKSFFLAAISAAAFSGTARGAADPLLVVVESGPGVGVDARDVRQTIGAELGIPVVAPDDAAAAGATDVLIVAVDKTEIRMSLRGGAADRVARTIPSPEGRPARLREIGWLAGNLARDQVSGIVAVPADRPAGPQDLVLAAGEVAPATQPPPAAPPPVIPTMSASAPEPEATVSVRPVEAATPLRPRWAITAAGGPTATYSGSSSAEGNSTVTRHAGYQLEMQHQASPDGLILGAAVDVGTDSSSLGSQRLGIAGFAGSGWRHRRWFLETTAGVGLELARLPETTRTVTNSSVSGSSSETTVGSALEPVLYLRGVGTVGVSISTSLDLVARLGVDVASSGGFANDFLAATAGLRFTVP